MKRRLIVLRHAKAQRGNTTDHERPLTARGRSDALAAGRWLAKAELIPDLAVCSTATRAKETWALAAAELPDPIATTYEREAYHAEVEDLIGLLRVHGGDARTVVIVGHNPGLRTLIVALGADGSTELRREAADHLPTAGIAVLEIPLPWSDLAEGQATLVDFAVARG